MTNINLESLSDSYYYTTLVSKAKMPSSCWGRYEHVAVMVCTREATPAQIRETRNYRPVWVARSLFAGTSARCAAAKALDEAKELAARYNELRHVNRHSRQDAAVAESLSARSGEDI